MLKEFFERFRFIKRLWNHIEYAEKNTERIIEDLREEIVILKKLVPVFEHRSLSIPHYFSFLYGSDSPSREEQLDEQRKKLSEEGFHFAFKRKHGEEIWIKRGEINPTSNVQIN